MVRIEPTADASLAAMRARSKFGIAIAAMIKMIATTISNSISEKPFCLLFISSLFGPTAKKREFIWMEPVNPAYRFFDYGRGLRCVFLGLECSVLYDFVLKN